VLLKSDAHRPFGRLRTSSSVDATQAEDGRVTDPPVRKSKEETGDLPIEFIGTGSGGPYESATRSRMISILRRGVWRPLRDR
jgi:hypothetical protein